MLGTYTPVVLGSGQDGGAPQFGSRAVAGRERTAASLAIVGDDGDCVLVDASPDLRLQQAALQATPGYERRSADNAVDAVLLTHAHMGHYAGLVHFGPEAHNSREVACFATAAMLDYLAGNEPWATLFRRGHLRAEVVTPGVAFVPQPGLRVTAHLAPHRPDFSDNVGYEIQTEGGGALFYLPDLDRWEDFPLAAAIIGRVDIALIDGTFFDAAEVPGRRIDDIPHPLVTDTVARFDDLTDDTQIVLTHLNWSNRLCDPDAPERAALARAGFGVAEDGWRAVL